MYDTCVDLDNRPFASVPQAERYFPGTAIETARQTLARCIQRGEGPGMVVGPSGTGKTLLCRVLAEQFKDSFQVAVLSGGRLSTRRALLQAILYELGRPYRKMDEGEVRLALIDYLSAGEDCPAGMLLVVDEAHTIPLRLLEELRMLTEVSRDGRPLVRLVLAGGPVLEERFAGPKLDSFSQRLAGRCYLEAFNRTETQDYIYAQTSSADAVGEQLFSEETCRSVYQATDGVPRLINQLCDHAMLLSHVAGLQEITPACVEEAWADLQQLPMPCSGEPAGDSAGNDVIEFGGLDDPLDETDAGAEVHDTSPLKISPESTEEPAEQLQRIEGMLADVEEDFQPAGSIKPEVELVFDEPDRPFKEEFEQEEVVVDRYATEVSDETEEPAEENEEDGVETVEPEGGRGKAKRCPGTAGASPSALPPATRPVRRREYGQLFVKLRSG